jgi:hypothetical protein
VMNSPRCTAAQNGCTTSEIMRLLNSINNTPISECCDDRANRRKAQRTQRTAIEPSQVATTSLAADEARDSPSHELCSLRRRLRGCPRQAEDMYARVRNLG